MPPPSEATAAAQALQTAQSIQASAHRVRIAEALNARARARVATGRWISDLGFYEAFNFGYILTDPGNLVQGHPDTPRAITQVVFFEYGFTRDAARLTSTAATDRTLRSVRAAGARGRAPWPTNAHYVGCADLADDTSCQEKTTRVLQSIQRASSGLGAHAVIDRGGNVTICAALDDSVQGLPGEADPSTSFSVGVALESAAALPQSLSGAPLEAIFTLAQMASMTVLVKKLQAVYPAITWAYRTEGNGTLRNFATSATGPADFPGMLAADFEARLAAEPAYDTATQIFRSQAVATNQRAAAQNALAVQLSVGQSARLLASYADVTAGDRSDQMQQATRTTIYVNRARIARDAEDQSQENAGTAAASTTLATPTLAPMTLVDPWVYDYTTGTWGEGDGVHTGGTV